MKSLAAFCAALCMLMTIEPGASADSIFDVIEKSDMSYVVNLEEYYLSEMTAAAEEGRVRDGMAACINRNEIIDANASDTQKISFDELYLLAKVIQAEAGSDWLTDDFRMSIGEVIMNRVASPEFPDTLSKVVYQKGQYAAVSSPGFETLVPPANCVDIALRLLQGERRMAPSVVFCSKYIQGEIFTVYDDWRLGMIYFCVSNNLELYPID